MEENSTDIYKAPEAELSSATGSGVHNFKRFSAWGVFGLSMITLGIYPVYWLYTRAKLVNGFHDNKLNDTGITVFILIVIVSYVAAILQQVWPQSSALIMSGFILNLAYMIVYLWLLYALRNRIGAITGVMPGPILTFFFNVIYLQYKINEAIDNAGANPAGEAVSGA